MCSKSDHLQFIPIVIVIVGGRGSEHIPAHYTPNLIIAYVQN